MLPTVDPDRYHRAAQRFVAFFRELQGVFVERDDLLTQIALALIGREHVLITGPPGTAKSQLAAAVLRRILGEKTGEPSVYTRQFTESTVQTDLVGPLDFKTLMESGRTAHFTDEGILGSVHAFLDEVFDGRDMLLRGTLNLLQERELKEGAKTTRGQIECALMTSNRYLAEILEGSRETLLAFVDRVAFVNYVPKGFADPLNLALVLRRALSGEAPELRAPLAIEDLDVLQAVAESVVVPDAVCDALARLLEMLEAELALATRSDPGFVPTRYFSTRTAVRAGRVLRAICVFDKLVAAPERPLEVVGRDFARLRLHLVLGGLGPEHARALLARELDPRERRQLDILRTEREIYERCLAKLPPLPDAPKPAPPPAYAPDTGGALTALGVDELARAAQELCAASLSAAGDGRAARRFREVVATLGEKALRAGLAPAALPEATVRELANLADHLEQTSPGLRPLARWVRGRALALLDQTVLRPGVHADAALLLVAGDGKASASSLEAAADLRLKALEELVGLRHELTRLGADRDGPADDEPWRRAADRLENEVGLLFDAAFRDKVAKALASEAAPLKVIARVGPALRQLESHQARLVALGAPRGRLSGRVAGERLRPLVRGIFPARVRPASREQLLVECDELLTHLRAAGLDSVIRPEDLAAWTAAALNAGGQPADGDARAPDQDGFRALRGRLGPSALATLSQVVARRIWPDVERAAELPAQVLAAVAALLRGLDDKTRAGLCELDLARGAEQVAYLESWWAVLAGAPGPSAASVADAVSRVEAVVGSGFLRVVRDEAALAHIALEARQLADTFPACAPAVEKLAARAAHLEDVCTARLVDLISRRADAAWSGVLKRARPEG
jgi:MoxR-like ATPase